MMDSSSYIALFDSGLGGISVLAELKKQLPHENYLFFGDSAHNPYGTKTREEITRRCQAISDHFMDKGCKAIVIACNTATSACVNDLRAQYPIDIIGMEPALKVAADAMEAGTIAVWATKFTLQEKKFARLMDRFKDSHRILKVACPKLVELVEDNQLDDTALVDAVLKEYIAQSDPDQLDCIVLGCTHFVFFKNRLRALLPRRVQIVDGNEGTARHLAHILEEKGLLNPNGGRVEIENSLSEKIEQSRALLDRMEEQHV